MVFARPEPSRPAANDVLGSTDATDKANIARNCRIVVVDTPPVSDSGVG
jgi:hypothetical protein